MTAEWPQWVVSCPAAFTERRCPDACGLPAQSHRASVLNLVASAIVPWNTSYLEAAKNRLDGAGRSVGADLLKHLSPLGWQHINLTGDYQWTDPGAAV